MLDMVLVLGGKNLSDKNKFLILDIPVLNIQKALIETKK